MLAAVNIGGENKMNKFDNLYLNFVPMRVKIDSTDGKFLEF